MRIALYTLPRVDIHKPSEKLRGYWRVELEKTYLDVLRSGGIGRSVYDLYREALSLLEKGRINEFRRILDFLRNVPTRPLEYEYTPPCIDCAIIASSEGELALRVMRRGLVNGKREHFRRVFTVYDPAGRVKAVGGIVSLDLLLEVGSEMFVAVA